ncbi:MAG: 30S ribosome-binding factor RbfA [Actinomycetaceae bacterium]|nr:30S ribosome-binding factor RbfA [Actinomycetaceae bacterium]
MADANRQRKVADRIQETVARLLERRIKDPRLGFVTVTDVRVTGDLQHATIFYTVLGSKKDVENSRKALESAKGLIRSEVGKALGIRLTPSIEFQPDSLPQSAAQIEDALMRAQQADRELAEVAKNAQYAGEADPYKRAEEPDDE